MSLRHLPLALLALTFLLAPILGGYVWVEVMPVAPGLVGMLEAVGGPAAAPLAHALIVLPALLGLCIAWVRRSVAPIPPLSVNVLGGILAAVLAGSLLLSSFRSLSLLTLIEWFAYGAAFAATVVIAGRRTGPLVCLGALVAGVAWIAVMGIQEYVATKSIDPTWRIFSLWMNPNALAGMLLIGGFLSLGLTAGLTRVAASAAGAASVFIAFALLLTQSKGAFLAAVVGLIAFVGVGWLARPSGFKFAGGLARAFACLGIVAVLAFGLKAQQTAPQSGPNAGVFGRLTNANANAEQSGEFRANLWKGAMASMKQQPLGYGIGTYPQESARTGLTTKTVMAHNSYLQLGADAGILAPLLLVAFAIVSLFKSLRFARKSWPGHHWPRAGLVAAVFASGAHSFVDSDFYYFGMGLSVFMLLALGLSMAVDGPSPEFAPRPQRLAGTAVVAALGLLMMHLGLLEARKGQLRYAILAGDAESARSVSEGLSGLASGHGDYWYLRSALSDPESARKDLELACTLAPTGRHLRALAKMRASSGDHAGAESALRAALIRDPNDLITLDQLRELLVQLEAYDQAEVIARRMIAVEDTPYLKVRSLPELVPTETYRARTWLALRTTGEERIALLKGALQGYETFAATTGPQVANILKSNPDADFAGVGLSRADGILTEGIACANLLVDYDSASAEDWRAKARELELVRVGLAEAASAGRSVGNTTSGIP